MIGTREFGDGSWMWFVPTCLAVTVECVWCPRVWLWQLDVICADEFGGASWMWLVPLDVICACVPVAVGCVWCPGVWPWTFDVIGTHEFGDASWMWFVPACVAAAVGCGWGPTRVGVAVGYGCPPRVWR